MERIENNRLLIAFYGDDFTGSTDALESLSNFGIKTVLFIEPPTAAQLCRYENLQAIGVAGMSRSLSPLAMEQTLTPAFESLGQLNPKYIHYKVCSTFDSSPTIGSIGKAIDIGAAVFNAQTVPLLVAAPVLGRYCLFGNLFARMGIGSDGAIFRLDRHPSMSQHPTTPAHESDLRLHLAQQTNKKIGLVNILDLHQFNDTAVKPDLSEEIVLFDALVQSDLRPIGLLIDSLARDKVVFSVGSSGIGMALGAHWQQEGLVNAPTAWQKPDVNGPVFVVSGSCSAVTANQITYAIEKGFADIAIETTTLAHTVNLGAQDLSSQIMNSARAYAEKVVNSIIEGKSVIAHTSLGMADERVVETEKIFKQKNCDQGDTAKLYGTLLGLIANEVLRMTDIKLVIIAGGDSSSYAARAMGVEAVEMIAPFSPGSPICLAHAPNSPIDQRQVIFKGGQVGKPDFFVRSINISD